MDTATVNRDGPVGSSTMCRLSSDDPLGGTMCRLSRDDTLGSIMCHLSRGGSTISL